MHPDIRRSSHTAEFMMVGVHVLATLEGLPRATGRTEAGTTVLFMEMVRSV